MISQDPRWTEISASLRKGTLHVKVSRAKVGVILQVLVSEKKDLLTKEILDSRMALVFQGSTNDWNNDLITLKALPADEIVTEFILAIEAGLRNEPGVDWIARVGGPASEVQDTLASLFEGS